MTHPTSFSLWPILLFLTITLISLRVPTCLCADDAQFLNCSSAIQCGDLQNISFPFWGSNRPSYCGLGEEFELTCEDNTTALLTLNNLKYRLLSYDNSTKRVTVARDDYWGTLCPSTFYNSSQDPSPFTYTSDTAANNLTFYYGCQTTAPTTSLMTSQFDCTINSSTIIGYFLTKNVSDITNLGSVDQTTVLSYFGACETSVVVPAYVSAIQSIETSNPINNNTVEAALEQGFGLQWTDTNCAGCIGSGGQCGRNESSNDFVCYCSGGPTSSACSGSGSESILRKWLIISTVCAAIVLVGIMATVLRIWFCKHRKSSFYEDNNNNVEVVINSQGFLTPKRYKYSGLKKITNSFTVKIGQGGYGTVYKGKLSDGQLVAVKLLTKSKGHGEEFINEVASISRTSHVNVVNLLGFCYEKNRRALIYKFMPNGSLDKFIPPEGALHTSLKIDWKILHQIVLGVARGLEYLHRGCITRILHFDIKPQNILLDEDLIPKISDFGLAKLCLGKESIVSLLDTRGTFGYIAPEVFSRNFGRVSHKSDVYSYGMLVLAMVYGKSINNDQVSHSSDLYFPHNIYKQLKPDMDFKFQGIVTHEEEEIARKLILVSFWCIQTHPFDRPSITKVIEMLEGSIHSVDMPPEPFLSNQMRQHQSLAMAMPSSSSNKDDDEEESSLVVDKILGSMK